jgi:hypothetical protein
MLSIENSGMPAFTMQDFERITAATQINHIKADTPKSFVIRLKGNKRVIVLDKNLTGRDLANTARKLLRLSFSMILLIALTDGFSF